MLKSRQKKRPWERPDAHEMASVHDALVLAYGPRPWKADGEPILDSLVATVLSQATSDKNSHRAFDALKAAYPDWDAVRTARVTRLEKVIRHGGLARQKSARIKDILQKIHALHGVTSLEHLREASTTTIKDELGALPGVGAKTVACVLMFTLRRPDFPVDTHVHRIANRLGWVRPQAGAVETYEHLNTRVPDRWTYEMHVLLIQHGRETCKAQSPRCSECALRDGCDAYAQAVR